MSWFTNYLLVGLGTVLAACVRARRCGHWPSSLEREVRRALNPSRDRLLNKAFDIAIEPALMFATGILAWPLVFIAWAWEQRLRRGRAKAALASGLARLEERQFRVRHDELLEVVQILDIEQIELVDDPLNAAPRLPFGHRNCQWKRFLATAPTGSAIWKFRSNRPGDFGWTEERSGYVHVGDERPGDFMLSSFAVRRVLVPR